MGTTSKKHGLVSGVTPLVGCRKQTAKEIIQQAIILQTKHDIPKRISRSRLTRAAADVFSQDRLLTRNECVDYRHGCVLNNVYRYSSCGESILLEGCLQCPSRLLLNSSVTNKQFHSWHLHEAVLRSYSNTAVFAPTMLLT